MNKNYTTKTAALNAVTVDTRILDSKKIILNGKNILDYINNLESNSYDTRDPQLKNDELDIWNTTISLSDNGHIEVKPHVHSIKNNEDTDWEFVYEGITESQVNTLKTAVKIVDDEVLGTDDEHIMYWQTDGLTDGYSLFNRCSNLTTFNSDLSSLTEGSYMFGVSRNLTAFNSDLSSLKKAEAMFSVCPTLTTFNSDLSSLTNGGGMFSACSNLTSFSSNLSSLTYCTNMFHGCKLDAQSVANIVHTLPTRETNETDETGEITNQIGIGIGCDETEEDQLLFAQECDCDTWQELLEDFSAKNWRVDFQFNGRPTTTYNMRRGETLPIYAKLEEVTDETYAQYTSADGSKFYNINYFHSTNGSTEGYDVFSSLEEAISTYNVTPKTNN